MFVWNAMPSITPMMSPMLRALSLISFIVATTRLTTSPPFSAISDALFASVLACFALSAFCRTVEVSCSMLVAVRSSAIACCSVRFDRSRLPIEISLEAVAIASALDAMSDTVVARPLCMSCSAYSTLDLSLRPSVM